MSYKSRMADIVMADMARRTLREQEELRALGLLSDYDYTQSRNITGEPSEPNRTHRASDDCWKRGLRTRTVGIAPNTPNTGVATVRVIHADGSTEIRTANSFRAQSIHKKQRNHVQAIARDAGQTYYDRVNQLGADGNIE